MDSPASSFITEEVLGYIDDVNSLSCITDETSDFNYIRLKTKDSEGNVQGTEVLGKYAFEFPLRVPENFYNTHSFNQIPFDVRSEKDFTYDPGYVVSIKDAEEAGIGKLFSSIVDADGVLKVQNSTGDKVDYPAGFFIDKLSDRIAVITNTNRFKFYNETNDRLGVPVALKVVGNYLYVLDSKNQKVVKYEVKTPDGEDINLTYEGFLNISQELDGASDISGYEGQQNNYLFISSNKKGEIIRIKLDKVNGESFASESIIFQSYVDPYQNIKSLANGLNKVEVIPNGNNENEARVLVIQGGKRVLSFATYETESKIVLQLEHENRFPAASNLSNIGYNLGDKSFFVTDIKGKLHVLSKQGEYLGSGGKFGKGERNEELYYPNIITSNFLATDAYELVVGNSWGETTGFKRIIPSPDLGQVDVIEKAVADPRANNNNELLIRYRLTSGLGVNEVKIKLNEKEILVKENDFYSQTYSHFLKLNDGEWKGIINEGWNKLHISLKAKVLTESNTWQAIEKTKEVNFYYSPSVINVEEIKGSVFSPDENNEINVYKSLFIKGVGDLRLDKQNITLHPGATLEFDDSLTHNITETNFRFMCGARLKVKGIKDIPKVFTNCTFDGLSQNLNMVSIYGDYTGGKGKGSAPSSMIAFINSTFHSYYGKAV